MADVLHAEKREQTGKRNNRRLRRAGSVPAVLYGHGEANVPLTLPAEELAAIVRHASHMVELQGAVKEKALIRDLQYDAFGVEILHVDLARVSEHERVEVTVQVELRGEAPGLKEGGVIVHSLHEAAVECPAGSIPDHLEVNVNDLHLGSAITVDELELPENLKVLLPPETTVVQCVEPAAEEEEEEAVEGESAEPEIIGQKPSEDDQEEGSD